MSEREHDAESKVRNASNADVRCVRRMYLQSWQ